MKKVLIISYFFPPANFAGSYRISSWARHLHKYGYYPIIVTRQWNKDQTNTLDQVVNNETVVEKHEHYEVHYVKVGYSLRERLVQKYPSLHGITKPLVVLELLLKGSLWLFHPSAYLYRYVQSFLKNRTDINWLVVTGNPFDLFKVGHKISSEYQIPWIADYRDGWTVTDRAGFLFALTRGIDISNEKKWLSNVSFFTTVNNELVEQISGLIHKPGYRIMNGYNPDDYTKPDSAISIPLDPDALKMVYNGTLYSTQEMDVFFDGVRSYLREEPGALVQIFFPGVLYDRGQQERISAVAGAELIPYLVYTHRLPKSEVIALQKASDIMLFFTHSGILKGTLPSKMFEYFGVKKPILISPNDDGDVDDMINLTKTGYVAKDAAAVAAFMRQVKNGRYTYEPSTAETEKYTREKQTQRLAELMDEHSRSPNQ